MRKDLKQLIFTYTSHYFFIISIYLIQRSNQKLDLYLSILEITNEIFFLAIEVFWMSFFRSNQSINILSL